MNTATSSKVLACLALATCLAQPAWADDYDGVVIFGDSLSDGGNVYALTGETSKAPFALIPSRPYAIGGHHFSNGKTWAERLAQELEHNRGGQPSLKNPGKNGNYAFGGARARANSGSDSPDSAIQVQMYLSDFGAASPDKLYIVQFGGNDLRDALAAAAIDPDDAFLIITEALQQIAANIQALYMAGARSFLVANVPSLEHAPAVRIAGAAGIAGFFTDIYNGSLEGTLQQIEMVLTDIDIIRLDMAGFTDAVVADPGEFDLVDVETPCLSFLVESEAVCENPDQHLFWDGLHPTAAAHDELADYAADIVEND